MLARPAGAKRAAAGSAVKYGVATGVLIACYTIWDKHAVADLAIPPLLIEWISSVTRVFCLLPLAWMRRVQVIDEWRMKRGLAVGIGALSPLSYLLVLIAMTFAPVSLVAPAREISVVIGVLLGVHVLGEGDAVVRLTSASLTICGVILLAMG
jgi:uncharacterized membrane protein